MKKIISIVIAVVLIIMLVGCSQADDNSSDYVAPTVSDSQQSTTPVTELPTEVPTEIKPIVESSYQIEEALTPFTSDRAWVSCSDSDKQLYYSLIDTNGYIVWKVKQTSLDGWYDIQAIANKDGVYILHPWSNHGSKYNIGEGRSEKEHGLIVIDGLGNEIFNSFNKTDEYKYYYMGYGDGTILAIENIANFSENNYYISEIDTSSGEIVSQFETNEKALSSVLDNYKYCGEGIYFGTISSVGVFWKNGYGIYNRNTHTLYSTVNDSFIMGLKLYTQFTDGYALGSGGDIDNVGSIFRVSIDDVSSEEAWQRYSDNPNEIGVFDYEKINEGLITDPGGIFDYAGNQISSFPDNWNIKSIGAFSGGYAEVSIEGADKKTYVTVVDQNGVSQYEPIKVEAASSWHGYVMVTISDEKFILNPTGEKTTREELDEQFEDYSLGDIAVSNGFERTYDKTTKRYNGFSDLCGNSIQFVYQLANYREIIK